MKSIKNTAANADVRFDLTDESIVRYLSKHDGATLTEVQQALGTVARTVVYYRLLTLKGAGLVTSTRTARNKVEWSLGKYVGVD
ncbi:MAG: winged helix-turn-helix domain-containing protein [Halobacteriota archaeon]